MWYVGPEPLAARRRSALRHQQSYPRLWMALGDSFGDSLSVSLSESMSDSLVELFQESFYQSLEELVAYSLDVSYTDSLQN